jgi:hypothetical protein
MGTFRTRMFDELPNDRKYEEMFEKNKKADELFDLLGIP